MNHPDFLDCLPSYYNKLKESVLEQLEIDANVTWHDPEISGTQFTLRTNNLVVPLKLPICFDNMYVEIKGYFSGTEIMLMGSVSVYINDECFKVYKNSIILGDCDDETMRSGRGLVCRIH